MVIDTLDLIFQGIADGALTPITGLAGIPAISFEAATEIASGFLQTHFVDKPMLMGTGVTRQGLGEYCVSNSVRLPSFWFDANDQYEIAAWLAKSEVEKQKELLQPMTPERIAQVFDMSVPESAGLPLDRLQRTHIDQIVCQRIAAKLWQDTPNASYADIHQHPDMKRYGNAGVYGFITMKNWLRSVAPAEPKRKGRPKKSE